MNKFLRTCLWFILATAAIFGCTSESKPIRLATYTYSTNNRLANLAPLAQELENMLGKPVETKSYPDVATFIEGIKANEVDIALINTLGYLLLSLNQSNMLPIATLKVREDASDNYKTAVLTTHKNINDLRALASRAGQLRMMFVAEGSTSGNLIPRLMLSSIGIKSPESRFKEVKYGGNHTTTLEKLIAGDADLCAIGSNEFFSQIQADSSLLQSCRLLWLSEEIPLGPVLVNNTLPVQEREEITRIILGLHKTNPAALTAIKDGWLEAKQTDKFHQITDDYYDSFRQVNGQKTDLLNILKMYTE